MIQGFPIVGNFRVMIQCITYNQSIYIEDTLKGFAMQQTTFPYICCIYDDASTDGEQEVLKQWIVSHCKPEDIKVYDHPLTILYLAPDKNNTNCNYAIHLQKVNTWGKPEKREMMDHWEKQCKYIALCEGDDYWIDSLKLQKQVDIMEANPKYVLCHTGFTIFEESSGQFISCTEIIQRNSKSYGNYLEIIEDILDGNQYRIQTMTTLLRSSAYLEAIVILKRYDGKFLMGDTQLWVSLLSLGDIFFMPEVTSVYRISIGSACRPKSIQSKIRFALSCAEMRVTMAELFKLNNNFRKKMQSQYQKKLNLYLAYNPKYEIFVPIKFNSSIECIRFYILKLPIIRDALRLIYALKSR